MTALATEAPVDIDASLVRQASGGADDAFQRLYERYAPRIFALCFRMCGNGAAAEDLVQETFLRAWRNLQTFRSDSRFSTWLYRIATNLVLDDKRKKHVEIADPEIAALAVAEMTGHRDIDLERAIATLPPRARLMLLLVVEGYRYDEVAELTGVTVGTVKQQVHRARTLLVERLS